MDGKIVKLIQKLPCFCAVFMLLLLEGVFVSEKVVYAEEMPGVRGTEEVSRVQGMNMSEEVSRVRGMEEVSRAQGTDKAEEVSLVQGVNTSEEISRVRGMDATPGALDTDGEEELSKIVVGNNIVVTKDYVIISDYKGITVKNVASNTQNILIMEKGFVGGSLAFDGEFIYYTNQQEGSTGVFQIKPDGSGHRMFVETEGPTNIIEMTDEYIYFTEHGTGESSMDFKLCIYDYHDKKLVNTIPYINNVKISNGKMYYSELRYDPSPVKYFMADTDGKNPKVITKKYMDGFHGEDGSILFLDCKVYGKYQLKQCDYNGKNKVKIGGKLICDSILLMNENYIYYVKSETTKDGKSTMNKLYAYSLEKNETYCLNTSEGYFLLMESQEGVLYLQNLKTRLLFVLDGIKLSPTRTKVEGNLRCIAGGNVYYYKNNKNSEFVMKKTPLA